MNAPPHENAVLGFLGREAELVALFLAARTALILALPYEGLRGYSDLEHFYQLAKLGLPFLEIWVEFPPLFPFLSRGLASLASGQQHVYDYLLVFLFSAAQAGSLLLFARIGRTIGLSPKETAGRSLWYLVLLLALPYGWWYFDSLAVFLMLMGFLLLLRGRAMSAGGVLGVGGLTKAFPLLALATAWQLFEPRRAARATAVAASLIVVVLGVLFIVSPDYTRASLLSQSSKGSWETVWALLDGNLGTGNFGSEAERLDPNLATRTRANPPRFPAWATLLPFAALGLYLLRNARREAEHAPGFLGLTWCLLLLWSPGWSPQWVAYLTPLILLSLPYPRAVLLTVTLTAVALVEWPLLLSRGRFDLLWAPIFLRTLLLLILALVWGRAVVIWPARASRREAV